MRCSRRRSRCSPRSWRRPCSQGWTSPSCPAFLWCVVLLLERRTLWLIVVGIALAFTKETGVLLYAVLLATYGLWTLVRTPGSARDRVVSVLALAPLTIPGVVFAAYLLIRRQLIPASEAVVWNAGTAMIGQSLVRQLLVPRIDRYLASYLTIMSILNFAWITTLIVAVADRRGAEANGCPPISLAKWSALARPRWLRAPCGVRLRLCAHALRVVRE